MGPVSTKLATHILNKTPRCAFWYYNHSIVNRLYVTRETVIFLSTSFPEHITLFNSICIYLHIYKGAC